MIFCTQGHSNTSGSRFCALCGEKLASTLQPQGIYPGLILGDRYRVISELGHGGFGRTYLAEDINRFQEPCVLKEFAPQAQGNAALQKAEELFAREAGVLYQLQHPQIPRFRELFRAMLANQGHLFLVQDYVAGSTYRQLLDARKLQGECFSELEVTQLLQELLPVLHYIHSIGVIHRDISPDNLMLRDADRLPVLIDFGGVKQVAAAVSQFVQSHPSLLSSPTAPPTPTLLGKIGYAPPEQMQTGRVYSHSDLYALGVTALVLLTGKEPGELFSRALDWQQFQLSPQLSAVLERMLATRPTDRYPSATAVLQALAGNAAFNNAAFNNAAFNNAAFNHGAFNSDVPQPNITQPPGLPPMTQATIAAVGTQPLNPAIAHKKPVGWSKLLLLVLVAVGAGVGWGTHDRWLPIVTQPDVVPDTPASPDPELSGSPNFSSEEQARKANLRDRREALGIDLQFYIALANEAFYERYPNQQGRTLSDSPRDAQWRERWDGIAADWLDRLEQNLSSEARSRLGSYGKADLDRAKQQVNQLAVGSRSLNDLADAKFFHLFPKQRNRDFIDQPIGQVWQAIASDRVRSLQSGKTLERIQFESGTYSKQVSHTLAPGEGRVYIAALSQGQIMRLNLQAPNQTTLLSVYPPRPTQDTPFLLSDSTKTTWSGDLPQSGIYEVVVISTAGSAIDYQITLSVDNITSTPAPSPDTSAVEPKIDAVQAEP